jgi:hypothetical protein
MSGLRFYGEVRFDGTISLDGVESLVDRVREVAYPDLRLSEHRIVFYFEPDLDSSPTLDSHAPEGDLVFETAARALGLDVAKTRLLLHVMEQVESLRREVEASGYEAKLVLSHVSRPEQAA